MKKNGRLAAAMLLGALALSATAAIVRADVIPDATQLAVDLNGVWHTTWGSESCELTLRQQGTSVTGGYVTTGAPPGSVSGTFQGNVLTGRWQDQGSSGGFRLVFAADGRSFVGTWGSGNSYEDGGDWNGRR